MKKEKRDSNIENKTNLIIKNDFKALNVTLFAKNRIAELKKRAFYYRLNWLFLRSLVFTLDVITIVLVVISIFKSVSSYKDKIISWNTFWGLVGPTLMLSLFIILLFVLNLFLIFFKKQTRFPIYRKAISEIQQIVIHYNSGFIKMSIEEKRKRVENIYKNAIEKKDKTIFNWSTNFLGEE